MVRGICKKQRQLSSSSNRLSQTEESDQLFGFVGRDENQGGTRYFIELERSNATMTRPTRPTSMAGGVIARPTPVFFDNYRLQTASMIVPPY